MKKCQVEIKDKPLEMNVKTNPLRMDIKYKRRAPGKGSQGEKKAERSQVKKKTKNLGKYVK